MPGYPFYEFDQRQLLLSQQFLVVSPKSVLFFSNLSPDSYLDSTQGLSFNSLLTQHYINLDTTLVITQPKVLLSVTSSVRE
jgi:hypothetical protein